MYEKFFGLKQAPFSIAPDPHYLFMSERHREALAHLLYGLGGGGGFVLLTGEIGAGKTTVCRCFLEQIPANCDVAYIFNPKLSVLELLKTVCDEFHIAPPPAGAGATVKDYVDALNAFLLQAHAAGRNSVLVIDEAQNLSADVLEQLRLLTNLETSERKLLQIVLIGQPELRGMLASPALEQLAQRVIARYHLDALTAPETAQYVAHRLAVAGLQTALPFDRDALARVHQRSRGVPRRINLLCDRALLGAYAHGSPRVGRQLVDQAAAEVFGGEAPAVRRPAGRRAWGLGLATTAGVAVGALGVMGVVVALQADGWRGLTDGTRAAGSLALAGAPGASAASGAAGSASAARDGADADGTGAKTDAALAAAAAGAGGASAAAASASDSSADALGARLLAALPADERSAWRLLAPAWGLPADAADPCAAWSALRVQCFRGPANLAQVRLLDRPGLLTLSDGRGRTAYALLTGIGADAAELQLADGPQAVPLGTLAEWWTGEFATLWKASGATAADDPAALARRLDQALGTPRAGADLRQRIQTFQRAQGLRADGLAGPMTAMQLNRATGVDEPHLARGR